jgi:CubicO group peptidase (beta-lactamase class C family)
MNPFATRKKQLITLLLLVLTGLSGKLFSQGTLTDEVKDRIRQVETSLGSWFKIEGEPGWNVQERMDFHKVPAVSIAVIRDFKVDWIKAYGVADKETNIPVTEKSLFQAASISKSLNGVGLMKLVQTKKVDLNTDINQYLVSWKFPYDSISAGKKITPAQLLSHSAGLTVHGFPGYKPTWVIPAVNQVLDGSKPANTKAVRSQFPPGTKVQYSGGGTTITQVLISDVSGKPYARYMEEEVLKPMGMLASFYDQPAPDASRSLLTSGHNVSGNPITGKHHVYPEQAAAGLWTNPTDLAKYIIETQLAYAGKSAKVLDQQHTRLRLTPFMENAGYGVFMMNKGGTNYFSHGGANEGFRCQYYGDIETGNGVVVMVNSDNGAILNEIINSVATVYNWKDFYQPKMKKIISVDAEKLKSYVGKYEIAPGFVLDVTLENNQLMVEPTNQSKHPLYPETENKFFLKIVDAELEFISSNGKTEQAILHQNGQSMPGKRLP